MAIVNEKVVAGCKFTEVPSEIEKFLEELEKKIGKEMFGRFLREEKAQGAIEYILLAGGIIFVVVIIFAIYSTTTTAAGNRLEKATGVATTATQQQIEGIVANMTA